VRLPQGHLAFHRHRLRVLLRFLLAGQEVRLPREARDLAHRLVHAQGGHQRQEVHRDPGGHQEVRLPREAKDLAHRLVLAQGGH
jgi:hypothetical protein